MTIAANSLPFINVADAKSPSTDSAQQRLSAAEAIANKLDLPDWSQMSDGIYRCGYIVALRTQALQWKIEATKRSSLATCRFDFATRTLFVQSYVPGCPKNHLRGEIRCEHSHATVDIRGSGRVVCVGQYLSTLGERWANWRLISLAIAEEADF